MATEKTSFYLTLSNKPFCAPHAGYTLLAWLSEKGERKNKFLFFTYKTVPQWEDRIQLKLMQKGSYQLDNNFMQKPSIPAYFDS